jgi:hypothetical protein
MSREILIKNATDALQAEVDAKLPRLQLNNALGAKIDINTLTAIRQDTVKQVFYEVKPSEFVDVKVGQNAYADDILTYKSYVTGDDFAKSLYMSGSHMGRVSQSDAKVEGVRFPYAYFIQEIKYNLVELAQATRSGNWSLIQAKEEARLKTWQLGIQKTAFLGQEADNMDGILTQSGVTSNTTLIPDFLSALSDDNFITAVSGLCSLFFNNSNATVLPNIFVMPMNDKLALTAPIVIGTTGTATTRIEYLEKTLKMVTGNPNFEVKGLAYCQKDRNTGVLGSGSGLNRYALYRKNPETLIMDIPIDYVTTLYDTIQGFEYQSVAHGQFSGVQLFRTPEVLYFDHSEAFTVAPST